LQEKKETRKSVQKRAETISLGAVVLGLEGCSDGGVLSWENGGVIAQG